MARRLAVFVALAVALLGCSDDDGGTSGAGRPKISDVGASPNEVCTA